MSIQKKMTLKEIKEIIQKRPMSIYNHGKFEPLLAMFISGDII